MPNSGPTEIIVQLLTMSLLCIVWSMFVAWAWLIWRLLTGQPILPEYPLVARAKASWGAGTVVIIILSYFGVSSLVSVSYPLVAEMLPARAGDLPPMVAQVKKWELTGKADSPAGAVRHGDSVPLGVRGEDDRPPTRSDRTATVPNVGVGVDGIPTARKQDDARKVPLSHLMLLNAVVEIVMLILGPLLVSFTCEARLRDFGLCIVGWWPQAVVGVVATLIAAPAVYAMQFLSTTIWTSQHHPVQDMIFTEFSAGVAALAVVTAVVVAPVFEELLFRGLLQSWLDALFERRASRRVIPPQEKRPIQAITDQSPPADSLGFGCELAPDPSPLCKAPLAAGSHPGQPANHTWLAIALTSLSFGLVHAPQWPAPIALCVLALFIGTVYYRTGSLIAAIFMHATFNGISTLELFRELLIKANQIN